MSNQALQLTELDGFNFALFPGMESYWQVQQIPILKDNFVFVLHDQNSAVVFDPGQAGPVLKFLQDNQLHCRMILVTHHHSDHIHGLLEIKNHYDCQVYAPKKNKRQLHYGITHFVEDGEHIQVDQLDIHVLAVPGHTLGHVAFWLPKEKWLFSGDVLFALGCGRIFEGSFEQMFETLQKVKSLPDDTLVYCTHDYFAHNKEFCEQEGIAVKGYTPHLPLELKQEKNFNPFLKVGDLESFRRIREKRNQF